MKQYYYRNKEDKKEYYDKNKEQKREYGKNAIETFVKKQRKEKRI